jgi:hypothetical protein
MLNIGNLFDKKYINLFLDLPLGARRAACIST